ncbi:MAG TPA: type II toxin-antitoxin system prevent-host-death family antitoxin [Pyrinomonadaceae bacterium]
MGIIVLETSYTHARANLAKLCEQVVADRDFVRITRRGGKDVVLISADELSGLMETAHLLRSPENASRLLSAIKRASSDEGNPQSIDELRSDVGLEEEK